MEEKWGKELLCDVKRGDGATRTACRIWIREGIQKGNARDMKKGLEGGRKQEVKRGEVERGTAFSATPEVQ